MLVPVAAKASYTNFVNDELIHFSNADNIRSLPHVMDGLKPSQRKILYSSENVVVHNSCYLSTGTQRILMFYQGKKHITRPIRIKLVVFFFPS
jgi:hypothetical protein